VTFDETHDKSPATAEFEHRGPRADRTPPAVVWRADGDVPHAGRARTPGAELLRIAEDAHTLAFCADGALITVGASGTRLWDVRDGRELVHLSDARGIVAISPDGRYMANVPGSFEIALRSLRDIEEQRTILHRSRWWKRGFGDVSAIAFSADSRRLATAGDPDTRVWSVADAAELLRIKTGPTEFHGLSIAFSPDGRYLATTVTDRLVHIWNSFDGHKVQRLDHKPHAYGRVATALAFSPDSRRLATLCADDSLWVWDLATGSLALCVLPDDHTPRCFEARMVAWHPGSTLLAAPCADGSVRVWDVERCLELLCVEHCTPPPRSRRTRWSGEDSLLGVSGIPTAVAISRDGTLLASGGAGGTLRVWALA